MFTLWLYLVYHIIIIVCITVLKCQPGKPRDKCVLIAVWNLRHEATLQAVSTPWNLMTQILIMLLNVRRRSPAVLDIAHQFLFRSWPNQSWEKSKRKFFQFFKNSCFKCQNFDFSGPKLVRCASNRNYKTEGPGSLRSPIHPIQHRSEFK